MARRGMLKSLARTVLKLTLPGVPDLYQGTEFWDFSLVDPDNRRPVDYDRAAKALGGDASLDELLAAWADGRVKQRIIHTLLSARAASPRLYAEGEYRPVAVEGHGGDAFVAFERVEVQDTLLVVVRRRAQADGATERPAVTIPARNGLWRDLLTGREVRVEAGGVAIGDLLQTLPVAVLQKADTA
jgi:(1->4)-alpha-D-glucan 1-alpha-D-glucosylmutase